MTSPRFQPRPASGSSASLRVGTAEREQAVAALQEAYADGRFDHAELDERIEAALGARTRADLGTALRGIPAGTEAAPTAYAHVTAPVTIAPAGAPASLDRSWAMVAHWLGFVSSFVGPLVLARTKGKESAYVREQAWEAVNFQLTVLGANVALGVVTGVTFGAAAVLFPILGILWFVLTGIAGLSAATGSRYRYPFAVRVLG